MLDPVFLNYVTRGLLWSVDKLDEKHFKAVSLDGPAAGTAQASLGVK